MGLGHTRVGVEKEQSVQEVESGQRRETQESIVLLWECQGAGEGGRLCHRCQGRERKWSERTPWGLAIREPSVRRS